MEPRELMARIRKHVAYHLDCQPHDLSEKGVVFVENHREPAPFLEICTMGHAVVISASPELLPKVRPLLEGKTRDEMFECPFVFGQSLYYMPDWKGMKPLPLPRGFRFRLLDGEGVYKLRGLTGFENSLAFDEQGHTPTALVFYGERDGEIVGVAGASPEGGGVWEMGVDVREKYRRGGLGAAMVSHLTTALLARGDVPIYCASVTNVGSQRVAFRAGLVPGWVSTYRTVLDGSYSYGELVPRFPK